MGNTDAVKARNPRSMLNRPVHASITIAMSDGTYRRLDLEMDRERAEGSLGVDPRRPLEAEPWDLTQPFEPTVTDHGYDVALLLEHVRRITITTSPPAEMPT